MRIIVVGATGLIGKEVVKALGKRHEVVKVGHKSGDYKVDMTSRTSIESLFKRTGAFDALVSAAGNAVFKNLDNLTDEDFMLGLKDKLMGQVNLVRLGMSYINDNGSFTLTSGVLATEPMPGSSAISVVNAGLNGFVRAAALEMQRGIRINVVSPPFATETLEALKMDTSIGIPAGNFSAAYLESIESKRNGEVIEVRKFI
jgi:NAD(P)-dependent dehydrogenase (short-subunit alcohol dehydrogenase family)